MKRGREGVLQRRGAALSLARRRRRNVDDPRRGVSLQSLGALGVRGRGRAGAAVSSSTARVDRTRDAGDRAEPDRRAHPRHPGRAHDPLHLPDQRRRWSRSPRSWSRRSISPSSPTARSLGLAAFIAAIVGGFNQVRGAIARRAAARRGRQFRRGLSSRRSTAPRCRCCCLIAVILFRPQGLLGRAEERTV